MSLMLKLYIKYNFFELKFLKCHQPQVTKLLSEMRFALDYK